MSSAGIPASSITDEPSAAVITISGPIGMHACDTTVTVCEPRRATATAPSTRTSVPANRRCSPGRTPPEAIPPTTTGAPGSSCSSASRPSTGKEKGSASITTGPTPPAGASVIASGQPRTPSPSPSGRATSRNGITSTPGRCAAHTTSAGPSSISRPSATIASPIEPIRCSGASASWTRASSRSASAHRSGEANMTTSVGAPGSPSIARAAAHASSAAATGSAAWDSPTPNREFPRMQLIVAHV